MYIPAHNQMAEDSSPCVLVPTYIKDLCFRFSHFHPDRYSPSERPVFKSTIGAACLKTPQKRNTTDSSSSVYQTHVSKPTHLSKQNTVIHNTLLSGIACALLYYSNRVLDQDPSSDD